jgi:hypothetical protein
METSFKAAGSHWALSNAAISDHTFIETHDPNEAHKAMGATLGAYARDGRRFVVLADERLSAFLELHAAIHKVLGNRC